MSRWSPVRLAQGIEVISLRRFTTIVASLSVVLFAACGGSTDDGGGGGGGGGDSDRTAYPAGPYGTSEQSVLANLDFVSPDDMPFEFRELQQDPNNKLLLLATSAGWCVACIEEHPALISRHDSFGAKGLAIMIASFEDKDFNPSDAAYAAQWKRQYSLPFTVVADPTFKLSAYYDRDLTPMNMFVDMNTMQIIRITTGFDETVVDAIINSRLN